MSAATITPNQEEQVTKVRRPALCFYFESIEHRDAVRRIAKLQGRSVTSWMGRVTYAVALKQLAKLAEGKASSQSRPAPDSQPEI